MAFLSQNQNRIYLAYFRRRDVVREGDVKYHTAFLVLPKKPDSEQRIGWRYHVTKHFDIKGCWQFVADKTLARTYNLIGLLLLGKIHPSIDYANLLEIFTRVGVVQGDRAWRCRHWVWEAINHLVSNGVISLRPGTSAEEVWRAGCAFTERVDSEDLPKLDLPTCDISGNTIISEVGPLQKE